jgi:hypothetical protein
VSFVLPILASVSARQRALIAQKLRQEEETMTPYSSDDLQQNWEFKIVRAITPVFHTREALNRLLEEEAQAGWVMVEKFDDSRVRFKRPQSARLNDVHLPAEIDPYRTHYGKTLNEHTLQSVLYGLLIGVGLLSLVVGAAFLPRLFLK